jgi:hypothetical protein
MPGLVTGRTRHAVREVVLSQEAVCGTAQSRDPSDWQRYQLNDDNNGYKQQGKQNWHRPRFLLGGRAQPTEEAEDHGGAKQRDIGPWIHRAEEQRSPRNKQ